MKIESAHIMHPDNKQWDLFRRTLGGPDGLDFRQDENGGLVWRCARNEELPLARMILYDLPGIDIEGSIDYFHAHGACCDCEIIWNVGQGLDLPPGLQKESAAL